MIRQRLLLQCPSCRESKLIDVAVRDDGVMGLVKCDECKARDILSRTVARPVSRRALGPEPSPEANNQPAAAPGGRLVQRARLGLSHVFRPAH